LVDPIFPKSGATKCQRKSYPASRLGADEIDKLLVV
jgi:hypothetical protein